MIINEMFMNDVKPSASYSIEYNSDYGIILRADYSQPLLINRGIKYSMQDIAIITSHFYTWGTKQYVRSNFINEEMVIVFMDIFKKYNLDVQYNGLYFVMTKDVYDKLVFLVKMYNGKLV